MPLEKVKILGVMYLLSKDAEGVDVTTIVKENALSLVLDYCERGYATMNRQNGITKYTLTKSGIKHVKNISSRIFSETFK